MSKYQVNQLVFFLQVLIFCLIFWSANYLFGSQNTIKDNNSLLPTFSNTLVWVSIFFVTFVLSTVNLHYFSNLIHLGSHNLLSKNRKINSILGWISSLLILPFTFIDFKITHLEHHKHQGDIDLDPDYKIVKTGSVWLLPLRIVVYKDYFFWKFALQKQKYNWLLEYCIQRFVQIFIIWYIANWTQKHDSRYISLFILPLIVVGVSNAMYLYFYPHYTNSFEIFLRKVISNNSSNTSKLARSFARLFLWGIDLSRAIHEMHHQRPSGNMFYYPEWWIYKQIR